MFGAENAAISRSLGSKFLDQRQSLSNGFHMPPAVLVGVFCTSKNQYILDHEYITQKHFFMLDP